MSYEHREDLSGFRGRGVVYLSFDEGDGFYSGY
jgi:hypothetical protein